MKKKIHLEALGQQIALQVDPPTARRLEKVQVLLQQALQEVTQTYPTATLQMQWIMAYYQVLEMQQHQIELYEAFCKSLEALLPP
ncbi:MAG: hypothetical protein ACUVRD_01365 [Bacteroidia bacterium]